MMIVFFDIRGIVHVDWVPEGQTVNQVYYKDYGFDYGIVTL